MLVRSTRPSGTIVTTPAIVPLMASSSGCCARNCEMSSRMPTGGIMNDAMRMNFAMSSRSSDRVWANFLACSVRPEAKESRPTRVATYDPDPATTKEPDITWSPTALSIGSASPVSRLSSISRPSDATTSPSTTS